MFKPMLAPNDKIDINTIKYPIFASYKLDGIRCLFIDGQMLSRSFKPIRNEVLQKRFQHLKNWSKTTGIILDGELYMKGATFQQITSWVMTENLPVPNELQFWCFDAVKEQSVSTHFQERLRLIPTADYLFNVKQQLIGSSKDVLTLFEKALENGYEGLILKSPDSYYKCGRATVKEGLMYKIKPFETFDGEIVDVIQATQVKDGVEKTEDNFGHSKTSKKIGDRELIEKASAFKVKYLDTFVKVTLAMSDSEKEEVWKNQKKYIGKWVEYKGMNVGAKDVPRHPVFIRFREEK